MITPFFVALQTNSKKKVTVEEIQRLAALDA
jgi:hypothetical protein